MSTTTTDPEQLTFAERVLASAAEQGLPPYEGLTLDDTPMRARQELVRWHGPAECGSREWVWPGRTVIEVPDQTWPCARPEDCTETSVIWFDTDGHPVLGRHDPSGVVLLCDALRAPVHPSPRPDLTPADRRPLPEPPAEVTPCRSAGPAAGRRRAASGPGCQQPDAYSVPARTTST